MDKTVGVILAAGLGKRMRSDLLKVLHPVGGVPMVQLVLQTMRQAGVGRAIAVVGHQQEAVHQLLGEAVEYAVQAEQRGTGHALLQAAQMLTHAQELVVLYGDTPLLTPETLSLLLNTHRQTGASATVLTARLSNPRGYGRIVRDAAGRVTRIVEEADCSPAEAAIQEVNTGIYAFKPGPALAALNRVQPNNAQGEYYLVDAIPLMLEAGHRVEAVEAPDAEEVMGINTRAELAGAEASLRRRTLNRLLEAGVTILDPATTYVDARATIGRDTVLGPLTFIEGACEVGRGCRLGPGAHVVRSRLADGVTVLHSMVEDSSLEAGVTVGPYSHLRAGAHLEEGARVGNFAEIKNSHVGSGSKVPHHSYLGDARVGKGVNIGAGVVTVNYNGVEKNPTVIGDGAFVGCNANLVAPVRVADGGYVAAGSTINHDVPEGALAIARSRQENKPGWVKNRLASRSGTASTPSRNGAEQD